MRQSRPSERRDIRRQHRGARPLPRTAGSLRRKAVGEESPRTLVVGYREPLAAATSHHGTRSVSSRPALPPSRDGSRRGIRRRGYWIADIGYLRIVSIFHTYLPCGNCWERANTGWPETRGTSPVARTQGAGISS